MPRPKRACRERLRGQHEDVAGLAANVEVGDPVVGLNGQVRGVAADPEVADLAGDLTGQIAGVDGVWLGRASLEMTSVPPPLTKPLEGNVGDCPQSRWPGTG